MRALLQDLRYSLRQLIKSPGFTLTAVISLALGIGASTAVFSVIYAALLNPYPYPTAGRIVRLEVTSKGDSNWASPNGPQIQQLRQLPIDQERMGYIHQVSPEYFSALHIPLLRGRVWNSAENHDGAHVAVINRTLAQRYFPNGDAIGRSVKLPVIEDHPPEVLTAPNIADSWLPIVGIVDDFLDDGLRNPVQPAVLVPYTLSMYAGTQILVRTEVPPLTLVHAVRTQLAAVNPDQQTWGEVENLDSWISNGPEWQQEHLAAWIFGIFAWLALALAAVGLYSVVAYTVAQRTNEFGIRMALGAQRAHLLRIVFASTLSSVGGGMVAGVALSVALSTILAKWAEGSVRDPIILLAGILLLGLVAGIACAIPARHASHVDPMTALRCD
jgi:hypothetical protein